VNLPVSVESFSGGKNGIAPGACGLFAILGNCPLKPTLDAAKVLQYRARNGAGIFLKGFYLDDEHYHFHIMYRDKNQIPDLEKQLESWGIQYLDKRPLVRENLYYEYDMPVFTSYTVLTPSEDIMKHKGGDESGNILDFIRDRVTRFNIQNKDNARIFSSSLNGANFSTAFELEDTIRIFDLERYSDKSLTGALVHMRWPTSQGNGQWWGAQPIVHGNLIGIHNGHLSSDKSNARALEELGIPLQVGTDSDAIFQMLYYLLRNGLSLEEIEWVMSRKFPAEIEELSAEKKERFLELTTNPILRHFKMSGPSTAVINDGPLLLGVTDRDHMRQFTVGHNDQSAIFASEERAIIYYSVATSTPMKILSPAAGKQAAFRAEFSPGNSKMITSVEKLEPEYVHWPDERGSL